MRLRVHHETNYSYDSPVVATYQMLRLTPRAHDGQRVISWRVQTTHGHDLPSFIDGFGNIVHCHALNRRHKEAKILAIGEVETFAGDGIVRGAAEPMPPLFFLRNTALTMPDRAVETFAREVAGQLPPLAALHALMGTIRARIAYRTGVTDAATTAAEVLEKGCGVCQDHSHLFIAAARVLGIPARYVGGYFWPAADAEPYNAAHAWAEAFIDDLGWVSFDSTNGVCPTESHIRASVGLDYLGAAPVRGVRLGGASETLSVTVMVASIDQ